MEYFELTPTGEVGEIVRKVWSLHAPEARGAAGAAPFEPVFPDGCMELVLNLGDSFERAREGGTERQPTSLFVGQLLGPVHIRPTGAVNLVGLRFQPWASWSVLETPAAELVGRLVTADAMRWRVPGWLPEALLDCEALEGRCHLLIKEFGLWAVRQRAPVPAGYLRPLATGMLKSVSGAAQLAGRSTRQLERISVERTGLLPRQLVRLARFQRALRLLGRDERGLATIAVAAGYHDQPHLTRDFGVFAGMTPLAYRRSRGALTTAFVEETDERGGVPHVTGHR